MKDRAPMFHPSDDHCFPEIHIIISEFHVMYVLSLFCTYYISLFEYFFRPQGSQDSVHWKYTGKHDISCFTGSQL